MGVSSVPLGSPIAGDFESVAEVQIPAGRIIGQPDPEFYTLADEANDDFRVVNTLLAAGVAVGRLDTKAQSGQETLTPGTWTFPASPTVKITLERILPGASTVVTGRSGLSVAQPKAIARPRIGVYQPWAPSMDEGWTRLVLEMFEFPYTTLHDAEIRSGRLSDRFDTIILPSITPRLIRDGQRPDETEPMYVGGLGSVGVEAIREFIANGGNLVCLEESCQFAIEILDLPVKDVLRDLKSSEFYAPGSILHATLNLLSPPSVPALSRSSETELKYGMDQDFSVYFDRSMAFEIDNQTQSKSWAYPVVRYARIEPLQSGWLLGAEKLQGKAALVAAKYGRGRVVLFGFPPQHRGQPHGTFRLLFNALVSNKE